jgi:protein-tyrosine phosphatase
MTGILVVCTGNVCRSPLAEGFLRSALSGRFGSKAPVVSSAGTAGWDGSGAMPESVQAASEREVDISGHIARKLTSMMMEVADLVVCMAGEHRESIVRSRPDFSPKVFTLKELVRLLDALPPLEDGPDGLETRVVEAAELRARGFAGNPHDEDIADPLGQPLDAYRAIAWELDTWCQRLDDGLFGKATVSPSIFGEGER